MNFNVGYSLRRFAQKNGFDVCRFGPDRLGRNEFADIRHLCRARGVRKILDVGANTGRSVKLFQSEFPGAEIESFEPYPSSYAELARMVASLSGVRAFPFAVAETSGRKTLYASASSELCSLLPTTHLAGSFLDAASVQAAPAAEVEVTSLDHFCEDQGIDHVDLLKIDTQGTELGVLRGAAANLAAKRITTIFLEVNFVPLYENQCNFPELLALLESYGYRFVAFYELRHAADGYLKWADALFVADGGKR